MREPRTPVSAAHRALVDKTDAFERGVRERRASDMACGPGCSGCCAEQLTVCDVEAELLREGAASLDAAALGRLGTRIEALAHGAACVFLEGDGRCAVYASRPLVCRTQGLPLRYPSGLIPIEAIRSGSRGAGDELTWCPLNFVERRPAAADVLDAARLDTMLALSNRDAGGEGGRRTSLADLGREAVARR